MTKDNPGADEREAVRRVRKFAEGDTINGAYRKMPIAAVTAFRDDLVLILAALQADRTTRERVLEEALQWYAEQVAGCRKLGRIGDPFRNALDADGGDRAIRALKDQPNDRT